MNRLIFPIVLACLTVACSKAPLSEVESHLAELDRNIASSSSFDEYLDSSHTNKSEEPRLVIPKQIRLPEVGSTYQLEPKVIGATATAYEYLSETESLVSVSSSGEIEVLVGGYCRIYVMAQLESGFWLFEELTVVSPSDEQRVFFE